MNGSIAKFEKHKMFGFIKGEDGKDYFFHVSSLRGLTWGMLEDGMKVHFTPTSNAKGSRAEEVNFGSST